MPPWPHDERGWWSDSIEAQLIFYDPEELVKRVTGRGLVVKPFMDYLEAKYKAIYGF